jgi:hypothetical protein
MEKQKDIVWTMYLGNVPMAVVIKNDKVRTATLFKLVEMTPEEIGDMITAKKPQVPLLHQGGDNTLAGIIACAV